MGLQQFERRLERLVEGVFAKAFRGALQPVEIGRRLTREMDLRRTVAPKGTLSPNDFKVVLSTSDRARFAPIEKELIEELKAAAEEHADVERYTFLGPVTITIETDEELSSGVVLVSGEMVKPKDPQKPRLVLPDGRTRDLGTKSMTIGRLPDCEVVLADPNVSRYHAEVRPAKVPPEPAENTEPGPAYEVADMGSTNGTKLNGLPLKGAQPLRNGDQITVGATTIRYEVV
jgi:hypothetical protein